MKHCNILELTPACRRSNISVQRCFKNSKYRFKVKLQKNSHYENMLFSLQRWCQKETKSPVKVNYPMTKSRCRHSVWGWRMIRIRIVVCHDVWPRVSYIIYAHWLLVWALRPSQADRLNREICNLHKIQTVGSCSLSWWRVEMRSVPDQTDRSQLQPSNTLETGSG